MLFQVLAKIEDSFINSHAILIRKGSILINFLMEQFIIQKIQFLKYSFTFSSFFQNKLEFVAINIFVFFLGWLIGFYRVNISVGEFLVETNGRIYNNKMNFQKRKQLKQLVCGFKRSKQTRKKEADEKNSIKHLSFKNSKIFPLLYYGLFSFQNVVQLKKFVDLLYKQINYAVNNLQQPKNELLQSKKVHIQVSNKKLLFLDLDQTLIYCNSSIQNPHLEIPHQSYSYKIKLRPNCLNFLRTASKMFDVYIFTASTLNYAQPIVQYLNQDAIIVKGLFHRDHCLKTKNGLFIKDLRIFENINLKKTVIIDNKIHSFSFQLQNGIPIQQFLNNRNDIALFRLQQILTQVSKQEDVQQFLKQKLILRKIISYPIQKIVEQICSDYLAKEKERISKQNI